MPYRPIDSYGLIGNMRSAALVGHDGSVDWLCLPRFDSPSVFGALLDDRRGGRFVIGVRGNGPTSSQLYLPDTNVLLTRHRSAEGWGEGVAEITDFMPVHGPMEHDIDGLPDLVRIVRGEDGPVHVAMECRPAFGYGGRPHRVRRTECPADGNGPAHCVVFEAGPGEHPAAGAGPERLALVSDRELEIRGDGSVVCEAALQTGEHCAFAIKRLGEDEGAPHFSLGFARRLLDENAAYWRRWVDGCTYHGRWRESVRRSALALKLLTYEPTGAIVAAATTSLPEHVGGERNWDYRYVWLRDAAFIVYALLRIGFTEEPSRFMDWLRDRCEELPEGAMLRPLYAVDGRGDLPELEIPWLEGYRGSRPVRVGNAAAEQLQLDAAGAVMDAAYLHNKHATPMTYEHWTALRKIVDQICEHWDQPDDGIWEFRSGRRTFTFSRMMCWVAIDRGVRIALKRSLPAPLDRWTRTRDRIYEDVLQRGYNPEVRAFTIDYDSGALDAATLMMPLVYFVAPDEPRMLDTIRRIRRPLSRGGLVSDFLVRRYNSDRVDDGVGGPEGAFNMCTLWLVEALTRAGRTHPAHVRDAELLFSRVLETGRPHGLFAEQIGPQREAIGNYPQGLTHLALISAAYNLDRALGR